MINNKGHCVCLLDSTLQSNLLRSKIADLSAQTRLEIRQLVNINPRSNMFTNNIYSNNVSKMCTITPTFEESPPNNTFFGLTQSLCSLQMDSTNSSSNHSQSYLLDKKRDYQFLKSLALHLHILPAVVECFPELLFDRQIALQSIKNPLDLTEWGFFSSYQFFHHFKFFSYEKINHPELTLIGIKKKVFKEEDFMSDFYSDYFSSEMIIEALKVGYQSIPRKYRNNKSVFRQAVKMNPHLFELADKSLKCDKEFVSEMIETDPLVMKYVNDPLNEDIDIAKHVVKKNGLLIEYFAASIRQNVEIIKLATRQNPKSIEFSLNQTEEIVIQVLERDGTCLQFVDSHFKEQKHIAMIAVKSNGHAYKFIDNGLKVDRDVVIEALCNGCPYFQLESTLRREKEIAMIALKNDSRAFKYIDECIRNDPEIMAVYAISSRIIINF